MPGFIKTKQDEKDWEKAKEIAAESGHKEGWPYITGIYKKMHGGKVASALQVIRAGDRVTILTPHGQEVTGKAVMRGPYGWVLNLGGAHGRPGIATEQNIVKVVPARRTASAARVASLYLEAQK